LVTIRKTTTAEYPMPSFDAGSDDNQMGHIPAHKDFRKKYFQGFKKDSDKEKNESGSQDDVEENSGIV
jgi:tRNA (guanine10-N2)-methyltransferase